MENQMIVQLKHDLPSMEVPRFLSRVKRYLVLSISGEYYRVLDDDDDPVLYKKKLFDVVDPLEHGDRVSMYHDVKGRCTQTTELAPHIWGDYHEGVQEAVETINEYLQRIGPCSWDIPDDKDNITPDTGLEENNGNESANQLIGKPNHKVETLSLEANDVTIQVVRIPPGEFDMGGDECDEEKPIHHVKINRDFWLGVYPVTQTQWEAIMGSNPSCFVGGDLPVDSVTWIETSKFCSTLSQRLGGMKVRLPTEAEWEYACRAGTSKSFRYVDWKEDLSTYAWYRDNSEKITHAVGSKKPNEWGLYDMYGNVWEWCSDWYDGEYYTKSPVGDPKGPSSGDYRVLRGGAWFCRAFDCRSAKRASYYPDRRGRNYGFRIAIEA